MHWSAPGAFALVLLPAAFARQSFVSSANRPSAAPRGGGAAAFASAPRPIHGANVAIGRRRRVVAHMADAGLVASSLLDLSHTSNVLLASSSDGGAASAMMAAQAAPPMELSDAQGGARIEQLSPTATTLLFIGGVSPFAWATYEFWRRIAVGSSFGTGRDSVVIPSPFEGGDGDDDGAVVIGEDGNPMSSRGRRTLDRGALTVAYVLFAVAGASVAIAIASVLMSPSPPPL